MLIHKEKQIPIYMYTHICDLICVCVRIHTAPDVDFSSADGIQAQLPLSALPKKRERTEHRALGRKAL